MKNTVILLAALAVGLAVALVLRSQRAAAQLEIARQETGTVSNQLSDARLKLNHQDQMNLVLKNQLRERDDDLIAASNVVAQARAALATTRAAQSAAQADVAAATEQGRGFAAERDGCSNRVMELSAAMRGQELALTEARARAFAAQTNMAAVTHQLAALEAENEHLHGRLNDAAALRAQLEALRRQQAAVKTGDPAAKRDYRLPVRLESDGSVVSVSAAAADD